ncbi:MAG: L,D-transpeptidase [Thermomicrobiales bacterium]
MIQADTNLSVSSKIKHSRRRTIVMAMAVFSLLLTVLMPLQQANAQATTPGWSAPRTVYIPETGQTLDQLFLDLWRGAGGASAFGYPITPEITQADGHVVQYLQYARFEYWPEGDENGNTVILGKLGEEMRPINVFRTMSSFSSITQPDVSTSTTEAMMEAKAWIGLPEDPDPADTSFVYVEETQHTIRGSFLSFWYDSGGANYLGNPLTEEFTRDGVSHQTFERGQLRFSEEDGVTMAPVGRMLAEKYQLDLKPTSQGDFPDYAEELFIPPGPAYGTVDPSQELWVDINLSAQYMVVYSGDTPVLESYVSTGRPGFDTPTGTYYVQTMYEFDDMDGVLGGEYYFVSQVPDVLYFTGGGHAIHGTYWHSNFGAVMSHGCVNLPMDVSAWLYSHASIGMRITIHY